MKTEKSKSESPRFSSTVDGNIVDGFLGDTTGMVDRLESLGFSRESIFHRARQLGLTDQFIKRCAIGNPDVALRSCLGCGERFLSVGIQNRLCNRCRARS